MFMVFDENKSWYLDDNIQSKCGEETVNKADPDFYKSNVMHSEFPYHLYLPSAILRVQYYFGWQTQIQLSFFFLRSD
jgi:hypothetical protein